jgi:hypothetical protein
MLSTPMGVGTTPLPDKPWLLDLVRGEIRRLHYSPKTERAYVSWIRQFIVYHGKRHPETLGGAEVEEFLSFLATCRKLSASTQNQALCAILFLYRRVLGMVMEWPENIERPQRPSRMPVVLTPGEVPIREKPVSESSVEDYEWKLIPSGELPKHPADAIDEGKYYVLRFDRRSGKFVLQHDTARRQLGSQHGPLHLHRDTSRRDICAEAATSPRSKARTSTG